MEGERDPRTYAIIGAAIEVHQQLGHGFLEPVYQEAMAIELGLIAIPFQKEVELPVVYKAQKLKTFYKADFLCFESVIVELKDSQGGALGWHVAAPSGRDSRSATSKVPWTPYLTPENSVWCPQNCQEP